MTIKQAFVYYRRHLALSFSGKKKREWCCHYAILGKYCYITFDHSKNVVVNNNNHKNKTLLFPFSIEAIKAHYLTKKRLGVIPKN